MNGMYILAIWSLRAKRSNLKKRDCFGLDTLCQHLAMTFLLLCICTLSFAGERESQIAEAEKFALQYIKDLRRKIADEKYEKLPNIWERFSLRQKGSVRNEIAYRVTEPRELTKLRTQFMLSETGKFSDNLRFKISGRFYYDAVFDLTDNFSKSVESDQESEIEFRDTYIDYSTGPFDVRLGRQQVVWGEAVALFFADVVNAKDLREFVLPDFDLIRVPQWGADIEYSKENFHAELVWLPDLEFDRLGVSGSEFVFPPPLPSPELPFTTNDPPEPKENLENSNIGLRLSYLFGGIDLSAFYYHTWTQFPIYYRSLVSGVYNFLPEYRRLNIYGATFAKELNKVVLKGEFILNKDDYLPINDANDADGIAQRNVLNYLLGADYTFFDKFEANFQFMQKVIFDYTNSFIDEREFENSFAFRVKTEYLNGKLEPEFLFVTSLMETDVMYRPKLSYKLNDRWRLRFGADVFHGKWDGIFGKFDKKSRVYCETIYNF